MCVGGKPRQTRRESLDEDIGGRGGRGGHPKVLRVGGCYPAGGLGELHHEDLNHTWSGPRGTEICGQGVPGRGDSESKGWHR